MNTSLLLKESGRVRKEERSLCVLNKNTFIILAEEASSSYRLKSVFHMRACSSKYRKKSQTVPQNLPCCCMRCAQQDSACLKSDTLLLQEPGVVSRRQLGPDLGMPLFLEGLPFPLPRSFPAHCRPTRITSTGREQILPLNLHHEILWRQPLCTSMQDSLWLLLLKKNNAYHFCGKNVQYEQCYSPCRKYTAAP